MERIIISLLLVILLSSQAMAVQAQGAIQSIVQVIMFWMDARIVKIIALTVG